MEQRQLAGLIIRNVAGSSPAPATRETNAAMTDERMVIVKEVLNRMDEISPAEDVNIVEGQLVDELLDNAMEGFLLASDIHKVPFVKELELSGLHGGVFEVESDDYVRMAWCSCPEWGRDLYESDLMESGSLAWKMQSVNKFLAASPLKPSLCQMPMSGRPRFKASPCRKGELTFAYVPRTAPEEARSVLGPSHGFWQAFLWYAAHVVLTAMGEPEMAVAALRHAQDYQYIPSGMPVPVPEKKKS